MIRRAFVWAAVAVTTSAIGTAVTTGTAHAAPIGAAVSSDYDGDGFGDLAIGEPHRTVNGFANAGAVRIVYGSKSGLATVGSQFFTADTADVPGAAAANALLGDAVASGNFDGDSYADVAIAVRDFQSSTGLVVVLYGSASGLHGAGAASKAELIDGSQFIPPGAYPSSFGDSLATADFNVDGYADLAVGTPSTPDGGGVAVLYGGPDGLLPSATVLWIDQNTPGVPGSPDANSDGFGFALAAGDFNGDGRADLGVGVPFKDVNGLESAGEVVALLTDASGLVSGTGALAFDKETPGVPGSAQIHGHLGLVLTAGDLTGDSRAELIAPSNGIVLVLKGSPSGPTATGAQELVGSPTDSFGASLAVINTDGNAFRELAVGAPQRAVAGLAAAGAVVVFPGTANGPTTVGSQTWTQDSPNMLDTADAGDHFGNALRAVEDSTGHTAKLVIGIRDESTAFPKCLHCGALSVLLGGPSGLTATNNQFIPAKTIAGGGSPDSHFAWVLG